MNTFTGPEWHAFDEVDVALTVVATVAPVALVLVGDPPPLPPDDDAVAQSRYGSANLLLIESNSGVDRSGSKSPLISHIKNPFRLFSITYSVLSQTLLSSSYVTKPPAV